MNHQTVRLLGIVLAGLLIIGLLQIGAPAMAATFGNANTQVTSGNPDFRPTLYTIPNANTKIARVENPTATPTVATDDGYYLVIGTPSSTLVQVNSIRIVPFSGFSYGTFVTSGSSDASYTMTNLDLTATPLTQTFSDQIKWIDSDGKTGYSAGDMLYWHNPLNSNGCATGAAVHICDIRLTSGTVASTSFTAGTMVSTGNADIGQTYQAGSFDLKYFDANANFRVDNGDSVYIVPNSVAGTPTQAGAFVPMVHDVRLVATVGSPGSKVAKGESDTVPTLVTRTAGDAQNINCIAASLDGATNTAYADVKLFLTRDDNCDSNTAILEGDVVLLHSGVTAGSVVSSSSNGLGKTINEKAAFSSAVFAVDFDGNGVYSSGDGVYWNRPTTGNFASADGTANKVTAGDLRLSPVSVSGASFSAGTIVAAGNADIAGAPPTVFTGFTLKIFDSERNTGVGMDGTNDQIYLGRVAVGTSSIPQINDLRLLGSFGQFVSTSSTSEWIPTLTTVTQSTFTAQRYDYNGDNSPINDILYVTGPAGTTTVANGAVRLIGHDTTKTAGSQVKSGDFDLGTGVAQGCTAGNGFADCVKFVNVVGSSAYELGDIIYLDTTSISGLGASGFSASDVRLVGYTFSSTSYPAGTLTVAGNGDVNAFQGTAAATPDCRSVAVKYWDDNQDGVFNLNDQLYLTFDTLAQGSCSSGSIVNAGAVTSTIPRLLDIRLSGAGGSAIPVIGASPGGGVTTPTSGPPSLSNAQVNNPCIVGGGSLTFTVTYTHAPGFAPSTANLVFNGATQSMTASSTSYSTGATYTRTVLAPTTPGDFTSSFSFSNSQGSATLAGPTVTVLATSAAAPTLTGGSVSPASGAASATYTWTVTYKDANNDAPTVKQVIINGEAKDMTSADSTYCNGAVFTYSQAMTGGAHTFSFKFKDATTEVLLPTTGTSPGPTVSGTAATTPTTPTTAPTTPTTGSTDDTSTTTPAKEPGFELVAFAIATIAAVLVLRRRAPQQ